MFEPLGDEMDNFISEKSVELFEICDKEKKGFIVKRDIIRLRAELAVESEQLEDVFDSLDVNQNGFLTLNEFKAGFSQFLTNQMTRSHDPLSEPLENEENPQDEFQHVLENFGAKNIFEDEETIMSIWIKLRQTDPILLREFEEFLKKTTDEMKRSKLDHRNFELALQTKSSIYDEEIKRMYEEMEQQIHQEKSSLLEQEKIKEREIREQMERELHSKEEELAEILKRQNELEMKFYQSNFNETEMKNENERLQKEKTFLEQQLQEIGKNLEESKNYIAQLQNQTKQDKRDRAKQTLNMTEHLAIEHENLVKELNLLKSINKKLLDERDAHQSIHSSDDETSSSQRYVRTQGSVLSNYISSIHQDETDFESDHESLRVQELGKRQQPIGAHSKFQNSELLNVAKDSVPDRLFKVAFIGDSGVGKTSIVQRFCSDQFNESFSATIGIDLQVKMLNINHRIIALQLWDTAGQERFRSITKQYFRKSDGIILVYDVTSELSFSNVRGWMSSVQESIDDDCVLMILGNKIDLYNDDEQRAVHYKDGAKLADEFGCLFFETSARWGRSIVEPMAAIARAMQEKEDRLGQGENLVDISSKNKKKRLCCQ